MFFICYHAETSLALFLVDANGGRHGRADVLETAAIRREYRDKRLEKYLPLAQEAFQALRKTEIEVAAEGNGKPEDICAQAVHNMRGNPHFLGRMNETGQAIDGSNFKPHPCCYACKGMMGYIIPGKFKPSREKSYLRHFNWDMRGDYAHSCAEFDASLQCATGKPVTLEPTPGDNVIGTEVQIYPLHCSNARASLILNNSNISAVSCGI